VTNLISLQLLDSKNAKLLVDCYTIFLLRPRHFVTRSTGLLNHISLSETEGILFTRTRILHTFGMRFPILVVGFDKHLQPVLPAKLVAPNNFVTMPLSCRYVAEISSRHKSLFSTQTLPQGSRLWALLAKLIGVPN
jgi:hypothetical protein